MGKHLVQVDGATSDSQHAAENELATARAATRAKALPAFLNSGPTFVGRVDVGLAFDRALRQSGVSTEEISRRLEIAPSLVKRIRRGEVSLGLWHWLRLPTRVRAAVEAELRALSKPTVTR